MISMAKRKYGRITNRKILQLFAKGIYRFDDGAVFGRNGKTINIFKCHRGYKWVRLYHKNGRKAVAIHRLIWMLANLKTIPRGWVVHHIYGKDQENPNDLEAITKSDHKRRHYARDLEILHEFLNS